MTELAIEAIGLKKTFGGESKGPIRRPPIVKALDGVDFKVKIGENYCLLGPNGSGKTTLIRCILGLLDAEGSIKILGYEIPKEREKIISKIGYMPQDISLYPDLSVKESLNFFGRIFGMKNKEARNKAVNKILDTFLLRKWQRTIVDNLSGGMKRRLSLACSLIHEPEVIFLDEPMSGIDPTLRLNFLDHFRELNEKGVTIITTTHVMDEAEKSRIIGFMREGKLIAEGTFQYLKKQIPKRRKLIVDTVIENTKQLADIINENNAWRALSQNYRIEVFFKDDSDVDEILSLIKKHMKIRSIQTVEPSLEDTFIFYSKEAKWEEPE